MTFQYRPRHGALADTMKEVRTFQSRAELEKWIRDGLKHLVDIEEITVTEYAHDKRIDWHTHVVMADGMAVGFTDGPVE